LRVEERDNEENITPWEWEKSFSCFGFGSSKISGFWFGFVVGCD
jgi:hypothetical protein